MVNKRYSEIKNEVIEEMQSGSIKNNIARRNDLKENFVRALKDKNFVRIANTLDISDDIKMKYTSHLMDISKQIDICKDCKGIGVCPYKIKGLIEYPIVENNTIKFVYKKCKYKLKEDKDTEYQKNIHFYKIPEELKNASFKKIYKDDANRLETVKKLKEFYDDYLDHKKVKGIYLHGNFGCGKSYLISALFNELAKKNIKSIVIYFPELLRSLKASFNNEEDKDEFEERFNEIKEAPLLLIDDIGAEKVTEWSRDEILGSILQYRMNQNLPTFFTSNLSIDDLEEHLSLAKQKYDKLKARRIIERIKFLSDEIKMIGINRRN